MEEQVVLLDESGNPSGFAGKSSVHGADTPLHLAFSCHLLDDDGNVLVTRRALAKGTWPGVWTNSFCGHPAPDESLEHAVRRRARFELGIEVDGLQLVLPEFRYRAVDASGVVENELCPVFVARPVGEPVPHPAEVAEHRWVPLADLERALAATPFAFSPWLAMQLPQLRAAGVLTGRAA